MYDVRLLLKKKKAQLCIAAFFIYQSNPQPHIQTDIHIPICTLNKPNDIFQNYLLKDCKTDQTGVAHVDLHLSVVLVGSGGARRSFFRIGPAVCECPWSSTFIFPNLFHPTFLLVFNMFMCKI